MMQARRSLIPNDVAIEVSNEAGGVLIANDGRAPFANFPGDSPCASYTNTRTRTAQHNTTEGPFVNC